MPLHAPMRSQMTNPPQSLRNQSSVTVTCHRPKTKIVWGVPLETWNIQSRLFNVLPIKGKHVTRDYLFMF